MNNAIFWLCGGGSDEFNGPYKIDDSYRDGTGRPAFRHAGHADRNLECTIEFHDGKWWCSKNHGLESWYGISSKSTLPDAGAVWITGPEGKSPAPHLTYLSEEEREKVDVLPGVAPSRAGYLGATPVAEASLLAVTNATNVLVAKLEKLHKNAINKIVMKKHGTRLSEASPIYQKIQAKLKKKGLDCTQGDSVHIGFSSFGLNFGAEKGDVDVTGSGNKLVDGIYFVDSIKDGVNSYKRKLEKSSTMGKATTLERTEGGWYFTKNYGTKVYYKNMKGGDFPPSEGWQNIGTAQDNVPRVDFAEAVPINLNDISHLSLLMIDEADGILAFIQSSIHGIRCHGIRCNMEHGGKLRAEFMVAMSKTSESSSSNSSTQGPAVSDGGDDNQFKEITNAYGDSTISFDVGLNKRVSMRVSHRARKRGTVNLRGKGAAGATSLAPSSRNFGGTFASLASVAPAAPDPNEIERKQEPTCPDCQAEKSRQRVGRGVLTKPVEGNRYCQTCIKVHEASLLGADDDDLLDDVDESMFGDAFEPCDANEGDLEINLNLLAYDN